jgi:hypothetical protein
VAAALAALLLAPAAAARGGGHKPAAQKSPEAVITEAIALHDAAVSTMSTFAKQAKQAQEECVRVAAEEPPQQWQQVEFAGKAIELIEKDDLKPYDHHLPEWVAAIQKAPARSRFERETKAEAIAYLNKAKAAHEKEFYEFGAIGASLSAHDCEGAQTHLEAAKELGDAGGPSDPRAWGFDGVGLRDAVILVGLHTSAISGIVQPYKHAGL